jgi:glycosyltransferase involved in cell wall biosynthesis
MSNNPRVSIGLPVFNGERYLERALNSILAQTFTDFELVISDNASTDQTQAICESYFSKDRRIRYYRNTKNIGAMPNFNRVFELSSGNYFKWASHDDLITPDFLQKCVDILDRDPSVILCYSWTQLIDEQGNISGDYPYNGKYKADSLRPSERFRSLIDFSHWCIQDFGLMRASELKKTLLYGSYTASDRVLLARLSLAGRFYEIPENLFLYRRHPQQSITMMNRGPSLLLYAIWNDPANANRILLPVWRLYAEYFKAAREVPLNLYERLRCYTYLLLWPGHNRQARRMVKDIIIAAALFFARHMAKRSMPRKQQRLEHK